jgi:hypothetical protein
MIHYFLALHILYSTGISLVRSLATPQIWHFHSGRRRRRRPGFQE